MHGRHDGARALEPEIGSAKALVPQSPLIAFGPTAMGFLPLAAARGDTGRAMSQENVEIVRRLTEALNARDLDRYYVEFFDPEVEWQTSAEDPDAATHRGLQAYKGYLEQWIEGFDGLNADVEEYIDVGDDRVFTWSRFTGRGRESGVPADWYLAIIFTIQDGKVVRGDEYFDRSEALEAVGLRE